MGYSIYIGNAVPHFDEEDLHACFKVERTTRPDAPRWPDPVGADGKPDFRLGGDISEDTNGRHPSYSSMANWAREVGLYELFLGDGRYGGLLDPHPGCQKITHEILSEVSAARSRWEDMYPAAKPGWCEGDDSTLAKLLWYEWWMNWALENCKSPAIENF